MEVRWVRSHRHPAVYVYTDGARVAGEQMAEYRGRTALLSDAISEGRLTLQINDARTSDDGKYQCLFEKDGVYQEADLDLKIIGLGSSPQISMEGPKDGEVKLKCTSEGWFPQPQVQWRDMEGNTIPSSSQDLTQGSQGLFQVEAFLLVTNSSIVNVTCSISSPLLGEEKKTTFYASESRMIYSWNILLIWGLLLLLLVGVVGLIWRKNCRKVNKTLDSKTAHPERILSEGNKLVTYRESRSQMSCNNLMASFASWDGRGLSQEGGTERRSVGSSESFLHPKESQQHLQGEHKDLEKVLKSSEMVTYPIDHYRKSPMMNGNNKVLFLWHQRDDLLRKLDKITQEKDWRKEEFQTDDFRMTGSVHPILAMVGEDALLTCQLLPKRTAIHMEVRWYRSEPSTPVFLYRDGDEVTEIQMEEYRGRVEWIEDGINEGSVALKIHSLWPSDHRQYWCRVKDDNYLAETSLLLQVASEYLGKDTGSQKRKYINLH
ncbi:hypothetical protein E5288_WYG010416 [Bos mutus]|uniref:Ig-like domain-containing protein n=1 Tax=Bos mutus TaxID=72004 RepID=A0A6B0SHN7_9CETA|nr:hypothetical protein [Bos mutus]